MRPSRGQRRLRRWHAHRRRHAGIPAPPHPRRRRAAPPSHRGQLSPRSSSGRRADRSAMPPDTWASNPKEGSTPPPPTSPDGWQRSDRTASPSHYARSRYDSTGARGLVNCQFRRQMFRGAAGPASRRESPGSHLGRSRPGNPSRSGENGPATALAHGTNSPLPVGSFTTPSCGISSSSTVTGWQETSTTPRERTAATALTAVTHDQ